MPESDVPNRSVNYSMASTEVRSVSREGFLLDPALASQRDLTLPVRRLLISPIIATKTEGRGGKVQRTRVGSTHHHYYSGNCFGCLLGPVLQFLKEPDSRTSEMLKFMYKVLQPAGLDILKCTGADAVMIQIGFACHHAIRGQLSYLPESKSAGRIDSRYGKKSVVLGMSACVYFLLSYMCVKLKYYSVTSVVAAGWVRRIAQHMNTWKSHRQIAGNREYESLGAERRALERGVLGLKRGKARSEAEGLNTLEAIQFELGHMRKAMWPAGKQLDAESQDALIEWINSDDFFNELEVKRMAKPTRPDVAFPLSALPTLPSVWEGSQNGSVCSSASSASSLTSVSSVVSESDAAELIDVVSAMEVT